MAGSENGPTSSASQPGDATGLAALIARAAGDVGHRSDGSARTLPPVERWDPPFCGDLDMEIKADGRWIYLGTPIDRQPLVRLFSTVLRRDADGRTYLVTPAEKVGIRVADAPFLAVEVTRTWREGEPVLTFRTNVGDVVEAGADHPLRFVEAGEQAQLKPYLLVRGRLEALISRPVLYELADWFEEVEIDGEAVIALRSGGAVFPVRIARDLEAKRV
ncbi:DUF1285 domain-containing protein [Rhizobium sp. YIM 134829]|uniref:DUF1285 domain-containing protein n=1 Tax=Rhizobium sp. YIM 134829 TaxID=3390453 RepID=UPI003978ED91